MAKVYSGKKYRKYKKGYRKWKKLSNRNIYSHKSAKSQAVQIAALNKKIKYVQKLCAPDIVQCYATGRKMFSNQDFNISSEYFMFSFIPDLNTFSNVSSMTGEHPPNRADSTFNIVGGYYRFNCIYKNNYVNVSSIGEGQRHANVRVIFLRRKNCFNPSPYTTDPTSYLEGYSNSGSGYLVNHLLGFREGVNSEVEILYDKWKCITEQNPQCSFKVKIPKVLQTYMNNVTYPKNALYGYVIVDGLSLNSALSTQVANVDVTCIARMCYSKNSIDAIN